MAGVTEYPRITRADIEREIAHAEAARQIAQAVMDNIKPAYRQAETALYAAERELHTWQRALKEMIDLEILRGGGPDAATE